ncbi:hypothetical protein ACFRJ1_15690 [Streptomyces sp. NPDC056773]|uniref:hypothetical protein n=1 Tax=unclassified Streptomyces TaxID=2593676 RepID=UPI0036C3A7CE
MSPGPQLRVRSNRHAPGGEGHDAEGGACTRMLPARFRHDVSVAGRGSADDSVGRLVLPAPPATPAPISPVSSPGNPSRHQNIAYRMDKEILPVFRSAWDEGDAPRALDAPAGWGADDEVPNALDDDPDQKPR